MKKKIYLIIIIIILVLCIVLLLSSHNKTKDNPALCDEYSIYGNITYDKNKKNYNIKSITYCKDYNISKYKEIIATLFEKKDNTINGITTYEYQDNSYILLDKFFIGKTFNTEYSKYICMQYKKNILYLEVKVVGTDDKIELITIPLFMDGKCK